MLNERTFVHFFIGQTPVIVYCIIVFPESLHHFASIYTSEYKYWGFSSCDTCMSFEIMQFQIKLCYNEEVAEQVFTSIRTSLDLGRGMSYRWLIYSFQEYFQSFAHTLLGAALLLNHTSKLDGSMILIIHAYYLPYPTRSHTHSLSLGLCSSSWYFLPMQDLRYSFCVRHFTSQNRVTELNRNCMIIQI